MRFALLYRLSSPLLFLQQFQLVELRVCFGLHLQQQKKEKFQ